MDGRRSGNRGKAGAFGAALALALALLAGVGTPAPAQAQGGEELRAYLDRTDELLDWAAGQVSASGSERARGILNQATQLQRRSRDLLARQRPLEAFSLARRARDAMWHAVRLSREAAGLEERIRVRSERFADQHAQLLERAREGGAGRAGELLERAREQAQRAAERAVQGDLPLAWKLLEQADDLLRLAARQLADGAGPERVAHELERSRSLVDEAGQQLEGGAAEAEALAMLADARDALARADAAAGTDPGQALQLAGLARRLAQRALASAGTGSGAEAVQRLLERFDARAAELAPRLRDGEPGPAQRAFERAREEREASARALADGRVERALRHARSAHDLLEQAARGLR
ncbi:MAG: hypothetical protein IPK64_06040 [bacterium]|nr:hypothetical protein [bacterium]